MYVLAAGLNHRKAPIEIRERFSVFGSDLERGYTFLAENDAVEGAVILSTCNRMEVYITTKDIKQGFAAQMGYFQKSSQLSIGDFQPYIYQLSCDEAMLHLFRVISGLDSMILGEAQILKQVKEAYQTAVDYNATDSVLNILFHKAMFVGKRVHTDTNIDRYPTSISHAAADLAVQELGNLADKRVLVIGAGEIGEITVQCLLQHGAKSVALANRTFERARRMADKYNVRAVNFGDLPEEFSGADLVISCTDTGGRYILKREIYGHLLERRMGGKMLMIDISVPRNIDPELADIPGSCLFDIDRLRDVVDDNHAERVREAFEAEKIVKEELNKFIAWLDGMYVIPVITALKSHGEEIKKRELKKAYNKLGKLNEREQNILNTLAHSIVNQLLHDPIVILKEMADKQQGHYYAEIVKKMFSLSVMSGEWESNKHAEVRHQR
ncbi:MAG: glutamyl-tRNA reductase [Syntrophomonadaceae bacterium]|jgi:glutamyl-tRNA reductase|nr:glutamyl-tRNA reductase [Syntrophomonadaceae bacterium]